MADITGTSGNDVLTGTGGNDNIFGLEGNDTLDGGPGGADNLTGGAGDDTYFVDADDSVVEAANEGYDYVVARTSYVLAAGVSVELMSTDNHGGLASINLTGNELANVILGNAGSNVLDGGPGGADLLIGFGGDDTYFVDSDDRVLEDAGGGYDYVVTRGNYTLAAGVAVELMSTNNHAGTAAINLTGNELVNVILGNAGANVIDGGTGGGDLLLGFGGDDTYFVDGNDRVLEDAGGGYDYVLARTSWALEAGVSVELMSTDNHAGTAAINLTGNELANVILGNAGNNVIDGGTGGGDLLLGFGGDDTYFVDGNDRVLEDAGGGYDYVLARTSFALGTGASVELMSTDNHGGTSAINLTGNELANIILGNAGSNTIDGGTGGGDVLLGFGGDDTYFVDGNDRVLEDAGGGYDYVLARTSFALEAGASVELMSTDNHGGTAAINLTGNELANIILGNAGNNTIDGGTGGGDLLIGFGGDDTFFVDGNDGVTEDAGGGYDYVLARTSYVLGAGASIELMSTDNHAGTAAINLTGNELANIILGNAGANVIDAKAGADTIYGFGGADTFMFTTALGGGNIDSLADFVAGSDKIQLGGVAGQPFLALATGALRAGTLVIGTAALDADDYLIYNSGTGALLFDADGNGAGVAVQFATLSTGLALNIGDFLVSGAANNAPLITSAATAQVAENSIASTIVYQVAATDADGDTISYTLTGADASLLTIDAGGAVRLITPANFEAKATYTFNVVASDSGVSTSKAVTLTITDVAEGGPSTPTINETAAINDSTGAAQAIDRGTLAVAANPNLFDDDLPSATIIGSVSTNNDGDFFSITLQAGELIVLDIDGTGGGLDSFLTLYNSSGVVIGENDDQDSFDPGSVPTIAQHNTDSQIRFRVGTGGTYYFSVGSFEGISSGNYLLHVSIGPPANAQQIQAEDIDALISGAAWNHTNLTFGFPGSAFDLPQDFEEVNPSSQFEAFNLNQQTATIQLLQLIQNVTTLTFTQNVTGGSYTIPNTQAAADLRFAESTAADVAYAYYPTNAGPGSEGGSAWFNHTSFNDPARGNYAWMGILHETGHALGLKHGHEFPLAVSADKDSVEYTVMTYRSYPGDNTTGGYSNEMFGFPQTLMMYDIAALQKIYNGANYAFNAGDSVYTWSTTTGEMSINGTAQGAVGTGSGGASNRIFMTVWDGGGTDTYDMSAYFTATTIDLRPGEWSTTSAAQLANLGQGHIARGNIANALMFQGNITSLIENAIGGSGQDSLIANQVANRLTGNGGTDLFRWMASGDAGTGAQADTITDFVRGSDKIDLSTIDANPATGSNDDFTFIGTTAFHNVAGEVRYQVTGGNAHVFADLDGNGIADMEIIVNNVPLLAGSDFNF